MLHNTVTRCSYKAGKWRAYTEFDEGYGKGANQSGDTGERAVTSALKMETACLS
jgi:hypothetical protein